MTIQNAYRGRRAEVVQAVLDHLGNVAGHPARDQPILADQQMHQFSPTSFALSGMMNPAFGAFFFSSLTIL